MIKEYRKKTTIRAEQFDGSEEMLKKWFIHDVKSDGDYVSVKNLISRYWYTTSASSVERPIHVNDWIVGKPPFPSYVIADDIFQRTYEEVNKDE